MLDNEYFRNLGSEGLTKVLSLDRYFKYINFHDGFEHILKNNTLKFTDPEEFNDPFDCNERFLEIVISPEAEKQQILEAGIKHNIPRNILRQQFRRIGDNSVYKKALKQKKKDFKVSCFSEVSDDVLMWSHYADRHKGLCLGFDLNILCPEYVLYPVNYIDDVQQIDGMANTPYVFYYWVTFKASRWKYEKEIRAVSKNGLSIIPFPKDALREVTFGCNVTMSTINSTLKELKKLRYRNLLVFKMEISDKTLLLKKTPLKF